MSVHDIGNLDEESIKMSISCRKEEPFVRIYYINILLCGPKLFPNIKVIVGSKKLLSYFLK